MYSKAFIVFMLVLVSYTIGMLSGYVIGYNDKFVSEIVAYRKGH